MVAMLSPAPLNGVPEFPPLVGEQSFARLLRIRFHFTNVRMARENVCLIIKYLNNCTRILYSVGAVNGLQRGPGGLVELDSAHGLHGHSRAIAHGGRLCGRLVGRFDGPRRREELR